LDPELLATILEVVKLGFLIVLVALLIGFFG
jgi:hypothetical protein